MESQVQSSCDAGGKDGFCVCVWISSPWKWRLVHSCVLLCTRVWWNTGQDSISVFGHGAGSVAVREYPGSVRPCSGKESSHSEAATLTHTPLYKQLHFSASLCSPPFQSLCFHGSHMETRMCGWRPKYHSSMNLFWFSHALWAPTTIKGVKVVISNTNLQVVYVKN